MARVRVKPRGIYEAGYHTTLTYNTRNGETYGSGDPVYGVDPITGHDKCIDDIQPPPYTVPQDLRIEHIELKPGGISGHKVQYSGWYETHTNYKRYNTYRYTWGTDPGIPPQIQPPTSDWLQTKLYSTFANTPLFDANLFLFELKDFPRMLKTLGDIWVDRVVNGKSLKQIAKGLASDTPSHWLEYSFGWGPLMNDLYSLMNAANAIDDRLRQLRNLKDSSSFNRVLYSIEDVDTYIGGHSGELTAQCTCKRKLKCWASGRLEVVDTSKLDELINYYAMSPKSWTTLLGSPDQLPALTVWNTIPFSWMVDYFINVGDLIEAYNGMMNVRLTDICMMIDNFREETSQAEPVGDLYWEPHKFLWHYKSRDVIGTASPALSHVPILRSRQKANLAALALTTFVK